jgi:glycine oxidase
MSSSSADVRVIGGGLIGTSIAWRLAQKGFAVTVSDAGNLGGEASAAGAGMLSPGSEATRPSAWLDLGVESLRLYPAFLDELHQATGIDVEFQRSGCLILHPVSAEVRQLHSLAGLRIEDHPEGVLYPGDALVDPVALLRSLRRAAEQAGVQFERELLTELDTSSHAAVVLAAGAWSNSIALSHQGEPLSLPRSTPVKGHLIAFRMRPGLLGPYLRKANTYVLQRADGLVIAGATEEHVGFDTTVELAACAELHNRAADILPELATAEPVRRWIGFRPGPENEDGPVLRRVPETNLWLAYGHYRNGILLTPVSAQRISSGIASAIRK